MEERTLGRLLFLNQKPDPTHWTTGAMDRIIDELNQFQPQLLEADPAYLAVLCRHAADCGTPIHQPRFITLTYEFPSRVHIRQIRRAFPRDTGAELLWFDGNRTRLHPVRVRVLPPEHGHLSRVFPAPGAPLWRGGRGLEEYS